MVLHVFGVGRLDPSDEMPGGGGAVRHLLAYVIEHPRRGLIVLDTGFNHVVAEKEDYLPPSVTMTVKPSLHEGQDLPTQMKAAKLDPGAVKEVVLSNLRVTHAGEIESFPNARVTVTRREHEAASPGSAAYQTAEYDDVANWNLLTFEDAEPLGTMKAGIDLLGDGSLMILEAAGPTEGNVAFLLRMAERPVLLSGDVAPRAVNLRHATQPPALVDTDAWWQTIWQIKRFAYLEPRLLALPGNDPQPMRSSGSRSIVVHDFATPAGG
jgi:glyoxylase-like metal-dependent hydrolase (beta-lactamase superfamily II)